MLIAAEVFVPLRIFFCRFLSEYRISLFLVWAVVPRLTIWVFKKIQIGGKRYADQYK